MSLKKIYWKQGHNFIQIFYCSTSFHVSGCSPFQLHVSCLILSCQIFKLNIQPNNLSILLKMLLCFKRPFHNAPLKSWLNCYFNIGASGIHCLLYLACRITFLGTSSCSTRLLVTVTGSARSWIEQGYSRRSIPSIFT